MYGPEIKDDFKQFWANSYGMLYDEETHLYQGYVAGGGANCRDFVYEYSYNEIIDDVLYIYARVAYVSCDDYDNGIVSFYASPDKTEESYISTKTVEQVKHFSLESEILQEKGLKYKFTFHPHEDGSGYYWVSSEPTE